MHAVVEYRVHAAAAQHPLQRQPALEADGANGRAIGESVECARAADPARRDETVAMQIDKLIGREFVAQAA